LVEIEGGHILYNRSYCEGDVKSKTFLCFILKKKKMSEQVQKILKFYILFFPRDGVCGFGGGEKPEISAFDVSVLAWLEL